MNKELRVGQVVNLNSGSPDLTITSIIEGNVNVTWIDAVSVREMTLPATCVTPKEK